MNINKKNNLKEFQSLNKKDLNKKNDIYFIVINFNYGFISNKFQL